MKLLAEPQLNFEDVILMSNRSTLESRKDTKLERTFQFYNSPRVWTGVPIMCANMTSVGTFTMAKALEKQKIITALHKYYDIYKLLEFFSSANYDYSWVTIGMKDDEIEKIRKIKIHNGNSDNVAPNIVIDVPNGHIEKFVKFCANVRNEFPSSIICAGNVTNPSAVQELIIHGGVDIVKLFVGPGSACETTKVTGVGCGTFTTSVDCSGVAHGLKNGEKRLGLVCGDGGFKEYGDVAKGYGAGLDFTMLGGIFAGTDECDESEWEWEYEYYGSGLCQLGELPKTTVWWSIDHNFGQKTGNKRKKAMKYYGMSSHHAQEKHGDGKKEYRASEGKILTVPYKGAVEDIISELNGGIRSACTYIGADSIKDMNKCAVFAKRR